MTIQGFGFSSAAAGDVVTFSGGAKGKVASATATTLTVTALTGPDGGNLTATVKVDGVSSGAAVQVATVMPVVAASTANLAVNATSLVIHGFGFSSVAGNDTVTFSTARQGRSPAPRPRR